MNGGFGLLLDGSEDAAKRATLMLSWDVSNGVRVRKEKHLDGFQLLTVYSDCWLTNLCVSLHCRWRVAAGLET